MKYFCDYTIQKPSSIRPQISAFTPFNLQRKWLNRNDSFWLGLTENTQVTKMYYAIFLPRPIPEGKGRGQHAVIKLQVQSTSSSSLSFDWSMRISLVIFVVLPLVRIY